MIERRKTKARVNSVRYVELPEGHRTTLVVGMVDMVTKMAEYLSENDKIPFDEMLVTIDGLKSAQIRIEFDEYIAREVFHEQYGIASCFMAFLIEKGNILKKQ